jgi:glycosyltransferase involved in cell wall biosynthesis
MKITLIILTHHRLELIKACLKSIENQQANPFELEIVALLNGVDDDTHDFLNKYESETSNFRFIALKQSIPVGEARNILIGKSTGEYICFIDDDVELPSNYFKTAFGIIELNNQLDVFGGPDQMKPSSSVFQEVLSKVMGSYFALGPTAKRHSRKHEAQAGTEINLILCNLWMKTEIFKQGYFFPEGFIRNEENILIANLEKNGKNLSYNPELYVYHERKNSVKKLIRVTYLSGQFRTYGFFKESGTFNFIFMVPQVFLILFLVSAICSLDIFLTYISLYLLSITLIGVLLVKDNMSPLKVISAMQILMSYHFAYSVGQFSGYYKKLKEVLC